MKQVLKFFSVLFLAVHFISCNADHAAGVKKGKLDSFQTVAVYVLPKSTQLRVDYVKLYVKDTFSFSKIDSAGDQVTATRQWVHDSVYLVPGEVDTARINGKAVIDSATKKPKFETRFMALPPAYVIYDFGANQKISQILSVWKASQPPSSPEQPKTLVDTTKMKK